VQDSKSYYVTISELHKMGNGAYSKRLRVAGNVQPGSIKRTGTHVEFVLMEQDQLLSVDYTGTEAPPDTFKDDSQALADGSFGRDGVFHAKGLQAKCASEICSEAAGEFDAGGAGEECYAGAEARDAVSFRSGGVVHAGGVAAGVSKSRLLQTDDSSGPIEPATADRSIVLVSFRR